MLPDKPTAAQGCGHIVTKPVTTLKRSDPLRAVALEARRGSLRGLTPQKRSGALVNARSRRDERSARTRRVAFERRAEAAGFFDDELDRGVVPELELLVRGDVE